MKRKQNAFAEHQLGPAGLYTRWGYYYNKNDIRYELPGSTRKGLFNCFSHRRSLRNRFSSAALQFVKRANRIKLIQGHFYCIFIRQVHYCFSYWLDSTYNVMWTYSAAEMRIVALGEASAQDGRRRGEEQESLQVRNQNFF